MNYVAQMRIGTLEITTALAAVALIASRPRQLLAVETGTIEPTKLALRILELGKQRTFEGLSPMTIGRDRECELVLPDSEVSRRHARFETQDGTVYVRDLESRNGTYLNGRRIDSAIEVREGDTIDAGGTRLTVERLGIPWT